MTQKERLVDLLKDFHKPNEDDDWDEEELEIYRDEEVVKETEAYYDELVDFLLSNGVIVPPCKAGDTVWFHRLYEDGNPIEVGRVTAIIRRDGVDFLEIIYGHLLLGRKFDEVFLTREAAEQALKERNDENSV